MSKKSSEVTEEKRFPKRRVFWLSNKASERDELLLKLEDAGYKLIQISAYGHDSSYGCYGLFERKRTPNKTVNKNKTK